MGQKANPKVLRLGITCEADSNWFSLHGYSELLFEDLMIRDFVKSELKRGGISGVKIRRKSGVVEVDVFAARPGVIIGKSGGDVTILKEELVRRTNKTVVLNIIEEKSPDCSPRLLGEFVAGQLEKRVPFRRAMKMAVQRSMRAGALGILISCSGRLGGAEIARTEWYREGKIPRHTFRANVTYAFTEALTTYGKIGVKVFIYDGDVLKSVRSKNLLEKEVSVEAA